MGQGFPFFQTCIPKGAVHDYMSKQWVYPAVFLSLALLLFETPRARAEQLCDASFQNCRTPLLQLIQAETQQIDVAFWFMDDQNVSNALIKRFRAGVKIRILMDTRADDPHPSDSLVLGQLAFAGIPMRERVHNGILHWKTMIFAGQGKVEFSGANYTGSEFVPVTPYVNYVDEAIYFSDDPAVVSSFQTQYDNWWTDTVSYINYANVNTPLARAYSTSTIDPELNFLPTTQWQQNYGTRTEMAINAEKLQVDFDMFRITNAAITDTTIGAFKRGVRIRMLMDKSEYRNPTRVWDAYNIDRLYMAGIPMKINIHQGQNHEKALILYGQGMTIFGSSNWTTPSFNIQQEHNYFTKKLWFFQWFQNSLSRKWNSSTEYAPFKPLPPGSPVNKFPANGAINQPSTLTLTWEGGPWGQMYDIYFGPTSTPPLLASNVVTGAPEDPNGPLTPETFGISGLVSGKKYYWRIVGKTMANLTASGATWSFTVK
jgi:phosphatidylserine/phosphatidylglycerophosphate/cardiolipin synthase-like enzyme